MNQINDGDIIVYMDAGCAFNGKAKKRFFEYINMLEASRSGILAFNQEYIEKDWTKGDLLDFMKVSDSQYITESSQLWGGCFLLRKNSQSVAFVNTWAEICINHPELITDKKSTIPNSSNFKEHRHDQSVFSILAKQYGACTLPLSEQEPSNFKNIPIQGARRRDMSFSMSLWRKLTRPYRYLVTFYLILFKKFDYMHIASW